MIKNLIFDFGGVIIDIDLDRCLRGFRALGFSRLKMFLYRRLIRQSISDYQIGKISSDEFCGRILEKCKAGTTKEQVIEAWQSVCIGLPEERLQKIKALRGNYKIFLLSNINELHWTYCRDHFLSGEHSSENYFDRIFLSYEMGVEKPDPEIFKKVIESLKIDPNETAFFDDTLCNVQTAKSLGFKARHVQVPGDFSFPTDACPAKS